MPPERLLPLTPTAQKMADVKGVKLVMSQGERAIGFEKRWITRHSLVQQIDSLLPHSAATAECWC